MPASPDGPSSPDSGEPTAPAVPPSGDAGGVSDGAVPATEAADAASTDAVPPVEAAPAPQVPGLPELPQLPGLADRRSAGAAAASDPGPRTDPWGWTTDAGGNAVPPPGADAVAAAGDEAGTAEEVAAAGGGRSRRHGKGGWGSNRRLALIATAAVFVLAVLGFGGYALASRSSKAPSPRKHQAAPAPTTSVVPVTVPVAHHPATCPLTGLPAPHGGVPQRPVLAVKVGNDPAARPQSGLEDADIVFDTLAEGGITRYIAVYQCGNASNIGPIRSVRWDDWHILQMFGHADLAFVHGIDPDVQTVQSLPWVCDLDAFAHFSLYTTDPDRVAPEATYSSTRSLWSGCPAAPAPPAIFHFAAAPPATATPIAEAQLDYSYAADVVWRWSAAKHAFLHNYLQNGVVTPDVDDLGAQLQATNVVIERVTVTYGAYIETPGGTGDVQSQTAGEGTAYVLSDGRIQRGTWSRPTWSDITQLTGANGQPMTLQPGNTWVEYVPVTDAVTLTP